MKFKTKHKIYMAIMAFILIITIGINVPCIMFFELITQFLHGDGENMSGLETSGALEMSDEMCRDIEEEGIVLLKNENETLPMSKSDLSQVNVFGWRAINNAWIAGGSGSVNGNNKTTREKCVTLLEAFEDNDVLYNEELISMYESFNNTTDGKALNDGLKYYIQKEPSADYYTESIINNAKAFSDVAIVVLGRLGGEGVDLPLYQQLWNPDGSVEADYSRTYLDLSKHEEDMLDIVCDNFGTVIVLTCCVNEINYSFLEKYENIDACLNVGGCGQSGTYSIYRVLRGRVTPSGKTTDTQPYEYDTDPTFANAPSTASDGSIVYSEGIYLGYKWYETADKEGYWNNAQYTYNYRDANGVVTQKNKTGYDAVVQFPFGFGLSYTEFEWEVDSFTATDAVWDEKTEFTVTVTVYNVGNRKGQDVVQLYATPPYTSGGIEKAHVNLISYAKTEVIPAGEYETVELTFTGYQLASYDDYDKNGNGFKGYEIEAGDYIISLRKDAHTVADIPNAEITYSLATGIKIEKDPVTDNKVENLFTGDKAYADNPIDGSATSTGTNSVKETKYLSRANFTGTFPTVQTKVYASSVSNSARSYVYPVEQKTEMPTTGNGNPGELLLYTNADGSAANNTQLHSGQGLVVNHELMMKLGADYDDPTWDTLLNQLSLADMSDLIEYGGYRTIQIVSIGKMAFLDNDGGSGLNRHINQADFSNPDRTSWTLFPAVNVLARSWNNKLAYGYGLAIGFEGSNTGISGWYSPSCNIHRSPFSGRNAEYVSEDGYISGMITAYQSKGAQANGMYTYIKHFAVNECETHREGVTTWLTEQSLREIYLRAFEIVVKVGGSQGIMSSFNRLGATWTGGNHALMTSILRDEWGFRGTTVTDYYAGSGYMALRQGVYAGQDLLLTGNHKKSGQWDDCVNKYGATFVWQARKACKNIIFAKCNVYYKQQTHDSSDDIISSDGMPIVVRETVFPWWTLALAGIDLVGFGSVGLWLFFVLRQYKKKPNDEITVVNVV